LLLVISAMLTTGTVFISSNKKMAGLGFTNCIYV